MNPAKAEGPTIATSAPRSELATGFYPSADRPATGDEHPDRILVVASRSGVRVIGPPGLDVHLVEAPLIVGPDADEATDRLLELTLPAPLRELVATGRRLGALRFAAHRAAPLDSRNLLATIGKLGRSRA